MKKAISSKVGFSLTELLIVVAIISVLTAIAIPVTSGIIAKSREKEDNLTATLYTSYVTKFANEDANLSKYTNFSEDEQLIIACAGKNAFPGYEQGDSFYYSSDKEMWATIRKSAIVSFKMQNPDLIVSDNYFINSPQNSENSFIYYYVKGTVKVEKLDDVIARTQHNQNSGIETFDNYWVCLDKEAGNTATVINSTTGNVFVKLFKYGLKTPMQIENLKDCNYTVDIYLLSSNNKKYYPVNSASEKYPKNNIIQFADVPSGTYQLCINASNITIMPSEEYRHLGSQSTIGQITVYNDKSFAGDTISHPYNVYLLEVSRGTVSVSTKDVYYDINGLVNEVYENFDGKYQISFDSDFDATYTSDDYITDLYDNENYNFLPTHEYNLKFVSTGYKNYTNYITASLWGIHNGNLGIEANSPFDYNILAQKTKVKVSGTINFNTGSLDFNDTISEEMKQKINNYGITNFDEGLGVELHFKSGSNDYVVNSNQLTPANGVVDGVYTFEIDNVEWSGEGTQYYFYFKNNFHNEEVKISNVPILVEGYDVIADLNTNKFFPTKEITFNQKIITDNCSFFVTSDIILTNELTGFEHVFDGTRATQSLPCGFYDVTFSFEAPYTLTDSFRILITEDNTFTITKQFDAISVSGVINPPSDGVANPTNFASHLKVTIKFDFVDGTSGYFYSDTYNGHTSRKVTISANSNGTASYTVSAPLASTYTVTVEESNGKCYTAQSKATACTLAENLAIGAINLSYNGKKDDISHTGSILIHNKTKTGHGRYCEACGYAMSSHNDVRTETQAVTCINNGYTKYYCKVSGCGILLVEETAYANGKHTLSWVSDADNHWQKCTVPGCGHTQDIEGHNWKHTSTPTTATCTSNGTKTYTCQKKECAKTKNESYSVDHTPTKASTSAVCQKCNDCGTPLDSAHNYNDQKIETEYSTPARDQQRTYTKCKDCDFTKYSDWTANSCSHSFTSVCNQSHSHGKTVGYFKSQDETWGCSSHGVSTSTSSDSTLICNVKHYMCNKCKINCKRKEGGRVCAVYYSKTKYPYISTCLDNHNNNYWRCSHKWCLTFFDESKNKIIVKTNTW